MVFIQPFSGIAIMQGGIYCPSAHWISLHDFGAVHSHTPRSVMAALNGAAGSRESFVCKGQLLTGQGMSPRCTPGQQGLSCQAYRMPVTFHPTACRRSSSSTGGGKHTTTPVSVH